ncbi:uncharacterized protein LOC115602131 [Strigops habroptila]|uniref:uncharacterized protein LOC115602131 n=1 Tax=Strigops habroptila TaxID=2489341 RepID=UPI0011CF04A9|nr:uncharacterized protein LOC115602131 [Strigops habroptila]
MPLGDLSPLPSATLTPLLRERLLLKSSCPPPYQECSQVRELSICLFKDIIQMADWKDQRQMLKKVRRSLVPLMLHTLGDETENVAKASYETLCVAAKLLKWKRLSHRVQPLERWRPGECLLEHDGSRAEEYVYQSLPYLQHAQVAVRMAAVRFIGLAAPHLKGSSVKVLQEIYDALYYASKDDETQVSSLAAQTMTILTSAWVPPRRGWILRALCCSL